MSNHLHMLFSYFKVSGFKEDYLMTRVVGYHIGDVTLRLDYAKAKMGESKRSREGDDAEERPHKRQNTGNSDITEPPSQNTTDSDPDLTKQL